jgi:hypothetical protein
MNNFFFFELKNDPLKKRVSCKSHNLIRWNSKTVDQKASFQASTSIQTQADQKEKFPISSMDLELLNNPKSKYCLLIQTKARTPQLKLHTWNHQA